MSKKLDTAATIALTISALTMAGLVIRREIAPPPRAATAASTPPAYVSDWEDYKKVGRWIGDSSAKVQIVEFADFECPFCKRFHDRFKTAQDSLGKDVSLLLIQYPLEFHRFAKPAALAAECADVEGKWLPYQNVLFDKQDSLGLKSWNEYAVDAGISDTTRFKVCVSKKASSAQLEAEMAAGVKLGVSGTPTVLINGWRYANPPYELLLSIAREHLAGKTPDK